MLLCLLAQPWSLAHSAYEYVSFVSMLGSLYVIAGGIGVHGGRAATPGRNVLWLAAGALLASCIGTTGACMLLWPAVQRANAHRHRRAHLAAFFIFIVGNCGGLLSPLGDPPLYLGFLRGVPFLWTLRLAGPWALVNGLCLLVFAGFDTWHARREPAPPTTTRPWHLEGKANAIVLAAFVGWTAAGARLQLPMGATPAGMVLLAGLAWRLTPSARRQRNNFSWEPLHEVAILFAGIFATMPPALALLAHHSGQLHLHAPKQFFWATGVLSAVLDNAPTYLTFAAVAAARVHLPAEALGALSAHPEGAELLQAISLGAVLLGAMTYVGNGPNLMVRALAERDGITMPSFVGYTALAAAVLLPIFILMTCIFVH
jgi:Na+/H+ antiporter NhaD/arsenite permease-like protein